MTHFLPALHLMTLALRRRLALADEPPAAEPLDHPVLRRLSLREIADLPLPRPAGARALGELAAAGSATRRVP